MHLFRNSNIESLDCPEKSSDVSHCGNLQNHEHRKKNDRKIRRFKMMGNVCSFGPLIKIKFYSADINKF